MRKRISAAIAMVLAVGWTVAVLPAVACGGTMYACDVYNSVSRLYQVDPTSGALTLVGNMVDSGGAPAIAFGSSMAFDVHGTLWAVDGHTHRLGTVNTTTGVVSLLPADPNFPAHSAFVSGITFNPRTNQLYAVSEGGSFYTIDQTSGVYTNVTPASVTLAALSFGGDGKLYGANYGGQLYEIDVDNNFSATALGTAGLTMIRELTAYGDGPGVSLFAESDGGDSRLATIQIGSPSTSTIVGNMTIPTQPIAIDGLAYSNLGDPPLTVPEPASFVLLSGLGAVALVVGRRRRRTA